MHDLIAVMEGKGLAPKSIQNYIATLGAIFTFATHPRRRWASANPCRGVEVPAVAETSEVRALDLDEVEALVVAARPARRLRAVLSDAAPPTQPAGEP